jgi:hypothetical protein
MTAPKSEEHRERDPGLLKWTAFFIVTAGPSDASPGGVVEEAMFAVDDREVLLSQTWTAG